MNWKNPQIRIMEEKINNAERFTSCSETTARVVAVVMDILDGGNSPSKESELRHLVSEYFRNCSDGSHLEESRTQTLRSILEEAGAWDSYKSKYTGLAEKLDIGEKPPVALCMTDIGEDPGIITGCGLLPPVGLECAVCIDVKDGMRKRLFLGLSQVEAEVKMLTELRMDYIKQTPLGDLWTRWY